MFFFFEGTSLKRKNEIDFKLYHLYNLGKNAIIGGVIW
jgi:hypothetical protein